MRRGGRGGERRARRTIGNGEIRGGIRILRKREIERKRGKETTWSPQPAACSPFACENRSTVDAVAAASAAKKVLCLLLARFPFPSSARWRHSEA